VTFHHLSIPFKIVPRYSRGKYNSLRIETLFAKNGNDLIIFPGSRLLPAACMELTQEQQRVLKLAKDGHNLGFHGPVWHRENAFT
jgi:hypothetical protein